METLADFTKLYGKVNGTLKKGTTYQLQLRSVWDAESIDTNKFLVLSEIGNFGGKNEFLAWVLIGTAIAAAMLLVVFLVLYIVKIYGKQRDEEYIKSLKF